MACIGIRPLVLVVEIDGFCFWRASTVGLRVVLVSCFLFGLLVRATMLLGRRE